MSPRLSILCIWLSFIVLLVLGIMMVASTGLSAYVPQGENPAQFLIKQCIFGFVGLLGALAVSAVNYRSLRRWVYVFWGICVFLLILCYVPHIGMEINGEKRWINLGFMTFQPSEIAKICMMITLADWYTTHREMPGTFWRGFILPGAILFGIPLVLILAEKDMGTAAALAVSGACVMYVAGVRHWLLFTALLVGMVLMLDMATANENRLERIYAWFDPQAFSQGVGRQQWISILAFARGGITGVGLGDGIEKFGNLPFAHTDFIFAALHDAYYLWHHAGAANAGDLWASPCHGACLHHFLACCSEHGSRHLPVAKLWSAPAFHQLWWHQPRLHHSLHRSAHKHSAPHPVGEAVVLA